MLLILIWKGPETGCYLAGPPSPARAARKEWNPLYLWKNVPTVSSESNQTLRIIYNVLVGHTDWGAESIVLLRLCCSLIRSKLDYSCALWTYVFHWRLSAHLLLVFSGSTWIFCDFSSVKMFVNYAMKVMQKFQILQTLFDLFVS